MAVKTAEEIRGFEYDWLAVDEAGHVALFSTAGGGYAPPEFLQDTAAHDEAIAVVMALPATTPSRFGPEVKPPGLENTWKRAAERGLYAFDSDSLGGPYRLVASPYTPTFVWELPPVVS